MMQRSPLVYKLNKSKGKELPPPPKKKKKKKKKKKNKKHKLYLKI